MSLRARVCLLALPCLVACEAPPVDEGAEPVTFDLDVGTDEAVEGGFSDYPPEWEQDLDLQAGQEPLPESVDDEERGFFLAGSNQSDDLFMFLKRPVAGLEPGARYSVDLLVEIVTEAPSGCAGIGGPPGEAVYVKAGATPEEPVAEVEQRASGDYLELNVDKGNQSTAGEDAIVLGHAGNTTSDCTDFRWERKTLEGEESLELTAAEDGTAWLFVGTDSGFEGRTRLYYTRYRARFDPAG